MRFFYGGDIHSTFSVLNAMLCAGRIERLVLEKITFSLLSDVAVIMFMWEISSVKLVLLLQKYNFIKVFYKSNHIYVLLGIPTSRMNFSAKLVQWNQRTGLK